MSTDETNAARRGSGSNDLLGQAPERDARWALAAEVAHGRMAGGWVPVDADLVLALHARLSALRDCRTCRHFRATQHCHSVLRCVDGSSYQRGGVVQLWEAAPVEPPTFMGEPVVMPNVGANLRAACGPSS